MTDIDGSNRIDFAWPTDWPNPAAVTWSDDRLLRYSTENSVTLYSPDTKQIAAHLDLPELPGYLHVQGFGWATNTDLTIIAYLTEDYGLSLLELPHGNALATIEFEVSRATPLTWSPDGSQLAFLAYEQGQPLSYPAEVNLVDRDGLTRRISSFSSYFDEFDVLTLTWSPDGRQIALWAKATAHGEISAGDHWNLFVLDVSTAELVDYCIVNELQEGMTSFGGIWSPDSHYFYIKTRAETPGVAIDIATGSILEFPADLSVVAWGSK